MIFHIRYLLISLVFHIIFFSLVYFLFFSSYFNKSKNLSIISQGSVIYINVISNQHNNIQKKLFKVNKQEFLYPEDTKSKISKTVEKQQESKKPQSSASDSSGGSGNTQSETIPVVNNDDIINCTPPTYPKRSLELGEEGTVIVRMLVDTQGNILNCKLHKTSGFKNLDNSVMRSVRLWVVKRVPPQKTWVEVSVDFFIR